MTYEEAVQRLFSELAELVIKKHRDYGTANIINTPFDPEVVIAVRLNEKLARLANLLKEGRGPSNEAMRDSWLDIIGYAAAGLMVGDGTFTLPMEQQYGTAPKAETDSPPTQL